MTYDQALEYVNGLEGRGWRLGLDRMAEFARRAGLEEALSERGYVHVAGTNGKGTTTALIESILRHQGWRTGAFFSPYVVDYRERFQSEGKLIEKDELAACVEALLPAAREMESTQFGGATKFEFETAIGLLYWQRRACDWVALEVGLGGRLDATNVVQPRACAITSISLDHTAILGHTPQEIAREKAGIVKSGIPVVVGEMPPEAKEVILAIAAERGAPCWTLGREVRYEEGPDGLAVEIPDARFDGLRPQLRGERIAHNVALAIAACAAGGALREPGAVAKGIASAWLPGRFDVRTFEGRDVLFDGAHNAEAAEALCRSLGDRPIRLVTNMLAGHEVEPFYRALRGVAVGAEVAPIDAPRALPVGEAVEAIERVGISARGHESVREAILAALDAGEERVVVTGSNYLVGEALRLADEG